ncbi:MAG: hypothetical protein J6N49_05910 [Alphaproteobacteria bacterium]|nr:hypothetical protein [Alphaproteobacteria bacterium]
MVELTEEQKAAMEAAAKEYENRVVNVQYDTLEESTSVGASSGWGAVTINHVKGEDEFNNWANSALVIEHEVKHNDNNDRGVYAYPMSEEQIYKINMHDEISANLASLVYLRDQYLKTGDISIFERENDGHFSFYGEAIKNGVIEPNSDDPAEFTKEMAFLVNGTQKMWMEKYSEQYIEQNFGAAKLYDSTKFNDAEGKYAQFYDQNYANAVKNCYTIGGIDFSQYMQQDVEIPKDGLAKLYSEKEAERFNKAAGSDSYESLTEYTNAEITQKYGLPVYKDGMSLEEYGKLLEHHLTVTDFISKVNESDYASKAGSFQDIMQNPQFKEDYNQSISHNSSADDNAAVLIALKTAARECYEKNGKFPKSDGTTYKKELDNLLTFDITDNKTGKKERISIINVLNPEDKLPIYNQNMVTTQLKNIKQTIDTHNSWWQKAKNWVADKKDKAEKWIDKPFSEKVSGLKNKFLSLFKKEEKAEVKNEVINPIYHGEFRDYKDENGSRVSPVMEKEILDLRKDVIRKPMPVMIAQPEGYDKWLEENNLLTILKNMPNFFNAEKQTEAVKNTIEKEVSLDNAQPSTQNNNKDKDGMKSRMKRDSNAAHNAEREVAHYYQTKTKTKTQTQAQAQAQTPVSNNNSSGYKNFIPQRRGGMEM